MNSAPFKTGGALADEHAAIYIERQADHDALIHLRAMDYLVLIEPRQQGKTSLINHLMRHPTLDDITFVYVDVTTPDRSTEATWYQTLCPRILRQLRGLIARDQWPPIPQHSADWRDFLCDVAMFATDARRRVVIALDEIGAVMFPGATEFFSVLRDVYNSRQAETELKQLSFLLAGAFHPRDLIKDDKISPFNIAQRVRLEDFTLAHVCELVSKGDWTNEQSARLAEGIYYWTNGQPYLTQLLCSYLGPDATSADVDACIERLRREDENHLPPLLERLNPDEKLRRYVDQILAGQRIKFYPRENRRQAQLELLGVIKADAAGFCVVRNRIYLQTLAYDVPVSKVPRVLLDFTSAQSLVEQDWEPYGSKKHSVTYFTDYDTTLGKRVLVKRGSGFDAALRYRPEGAPPLDWKFSHYELSVRLHPESVICINVLDKTGKNRTLLYSAAILSGLNQWEEFHIPIDKFVSDGIWHSLVIDLPEHVEQARWPDFVRVDWLSLRGELVLAGVRGCDNQASLVDTAIASPHIVSFASTANSLPRLGIPLDEQAEPFPTEAMPAKEILYLDTTATLFARWLADYTRMVPYHDFSTEKGRLALQSVKAPLSIQAPTTLAMEALHIVGGEADIETARPIGSAIRFRVIPLSSERVEVQAECHQPAVADYFRRLLDEIKERWTVGRLIPARETPPMSDRHLDATVAPSVSQSFTGGNKMDYERGLAQLKVCLEQRAPDRLTEFNTLEERFHKNERAERLFGSSENTRNEHSQIIYALNELALEYCGISFNDLCLGKGAKGDGVVSTSAKPILNAGKAWAVLVGVNQYEDPHIANLKVCVDDVTVIHQSLAKGYQVAKLLTDAAPDHLPMRANILGELSAIAQSAGAGDLLLFYFSGHGKAEGGESYLLSRDTRLSALKHTAVALRDVRELMDQSPARAKVIVLDACHSGASIGKAEPTMTAEFIQRVFEEAEGIAVLASCKQGQQSWEWPEKKRSVFTYYLLEALAGQADFDKKGFVTVSDANEYVTDGVKSWAAQNGVPQTPTLQYTVAGDIILSRYARSS